MLSDEWLPRYRLLENFTIKWNGNGNAHRNGNAYDRGDYNSSFALRAVELKSNEKSHIEISYITLIMLSSIQPVKIPEKITVFLNNSCKSSIFFVGRAKMPKNGVLIQ